MELLIYIVPSLIIAVAVYMAFAAVHHTLGLQRAWTSGLTAMGRCEIAGSFVAADIPAGTTAADLTLTWRPPGWEISTGTTAGGLAGIGLLQLTHQRLRRRDVITTPDRPVAQGRQRVTAV
ncbi:hypothetical protein [Nocardia sp. NPDC052112]|uniref:hypothetical protein n=1 Tax=Nocardia sp. NPDC052112 TaxID=3155646 RepID=UPI003435843B